jgi:glucose uptake protein
MSVAFPLTLGVALVIGVVWDYANATQANTPLTFIAFALLVAAVVVTGLAYVRLLRVQRDASQTALTPDPRTKSKRTKSAGATLAIVLSVVGGIALSTFPKILGEATGGDNALAPYSAAVLLSIAALVSSPFFVLFFTTFPVVSTAGMPSGYLAGSARQHLMGVAGGIVWGAGMLTSLIAAVAPRDAQPSVLIQYMLSNGALVVAAAWGLLAWQEFRGGGDRLRILAAGMMVLFLAGLGMAAYAFAPK